MKYTLSQAALLLQVKRDSLLKLEASIPQLLHCAMHPMGERYDEHDIAILRSKLIEIYSQGHSFGQHLQSIGQGDDEGEVKAISTSTTNQNVTSDFGKTSVSKQLIKKNKAAWGQGTLQDKAAKKSKNEPSKEGPIECYADKLYAESQGQMTFAFDSDVQDVGREKEQLTAEIPMSMLLESEPESEPESESERQIEENSQDIFKEEELAFSQLDSTQATEQLNEPQSELEDVETVEQTIEQSKQTTDQAMEHIAEQAQPEPEEQLVDFPTVSVEANNKNGLSSVQQSINVPADETVAELDAEVSSELSADAFSSATEEDDKLSPEEQESVAIAQDEEQTPLLDFHRSDYTPNGILEKLAVLEEFAHNRSSLSLEVESLSAILPRSKN